MSQLKIQARSFWEGMRTEIPIAVGVFPVGLVFGASALECGLSAPQILGTSLIIFAGSAQFVTVALLKEQAPIFLIIFTAVMMNIRHFIYSASVAEDTRKLSRGTKAFLAYFLTDECYAALNTKLIKNEKISASFFIGAGFTLWFTWQCGTLLGVILGKGLPASLHFNYMIDFVFLAIVVQAAHNKKLMLAVFFALLFSALFVLVPYKLNILLGAFVAVLLSSKVKL